MARFFFHLRTGNGTEITDDYGDELANTQAAEEHAIASVKDIVKGSLLDWRQAAFEVHDEAGRHVTTVWFREAAAAALGSSVSASEGQHA